MASDMKVESASCKVVLAATVAKDLLTEVSMGASRLRKSPLLVGFLANTDPAARKYAEWTDRTCRENCFRFELRQVDREDLETCILAANVDDAVDGIIIYYPIFGNRQDQYLQQITDVRKDVEGLGHDYIFKLYHNERFLDKRMSQKSLLPCTPLAVLKILDHLRVYNSILPYGNRLFGRSITVVNRSETVGRPLAALLANDGACVYSIDVTGVQQFTRGEGIRKSRHEVVEKQGWVLEDCVPLSDVVICGVPGESLKLPTNLLKEGAVCVNFSTEKVCGFLSWLKHLFTKFDNKNFEGDVKDKASIYVPAIGKVTIVVLLRNLLRLVQNREIRKDIEASVMEELVT